MNPILLPVAAKVERRGEEEEEKALAAAAKKEEEGIGSFKRRSEGERLGRLRKSHLSHFFGGRESGLK